MSISEKFKFLSQTRREQKMKPPHAVGMQGIIFCEQRSMATKLEFLGILI
jgi:hypothetical protein